MSGSPKNIQRDAIWVSPETTKIGWSITYPLTNVQYAMNASAIVAVDQASVISATAAQALAIGLTTAVGIYIQAPFGDNQPYRVKASIGISGKNDFEYTGLIIIGYAPAVPTGSDDLIDAPTVINFKNTFDELVMVDVPITFAGRALAIAVAPLISTTLATTTLAQLSVQNLGVKPPTMRNAIS